MADQHATLTAERGAAFSREQQILMIANEMHRASKLVAALYVAPEAAPADHRAALRSLLRFTPIASAQIPFVLGE